MGIDSRNRNGALRLRSLLLAAVWILLATSVHAFSAANVYREAASSVVLIFGFEDSGAGSSGTGSILTPDGLVLTNNHVIARGESGKLYSNLVVYFKPNPISGDNEKDLAKPYLVDVIARDADLDLALLRVKNPPSALRPLPIGNSEEVDIGENVAAIGHPGGGGLWTLTTGTVSSKRRDQQRDIFQTDTAINPGNSGGPLLDEYARLVGVNTFVRRVNEQGLPLEGLNYSLRSSLALGWVNRQGAGRIGSVSRASARVIPSAPAPRAESKPEPEPEPESTPRDEPSQRAEAAPEAEAERERNPNLAPSRMLGDTTESDERPERPTAPAAPRRAQAEALPLPPVEPEASEFTAPDGTRMYGVPNLENDLADSLMQVREAYAELTKRRDQSIDEMERLFDDYDNF
ncbi:MAG: S1C family serine protease [Myxococcota bacterium]